MKVYFSMVLILLCTCGFAQEPNLTNDLNIKIEAIVKKYIPFDENRMANSNYTLEPVRFIEKINLARTDAYRQIKSGSAKETTLKRLNVDYYLRNLVWSYSAFYQAGIKGKSLLTKDAQQKYVDSLIWSNADLNNEDLYKGSAAYRLWLDIYLNKIYQTKYKSDTTLQYLSFGIPISVIKGEIQNAFIRDDECYGYASQILESTRDSTALAKKIYQDFNAEVTNTYYREKMQRVYNDYIQHPAGMPAPDFTYTAVDGNSVTLSSLRGKYIYIDVWATWCGPCKAQIPSLMKMEKKYEDKNIQFVSLSVDKQADAAKWRKYVTDNKLTGYQVMADSDFRSDFVKKFNISSIPRFILIDPAGKVVDGNAIKPSDPTLKKQLDQLLGIPVASFALSPYARRTDFSGHWQLDTSRTKFEHTEMFISSALNVTENDTALIVERIDINKTIKESHYSQQFKLDGASTRTITGKGQPEVDSLEDNPDIAALMLDMGIELFPKYIIYYTEAWTLEDDGKTLVVDRQLAIRGFTLVGDIKFFYCKK